jgi:hypothetical protein
MRHVNASTIFVGSGVYRIHRLGDAASASLHQSGAAKGLGRTFAPSLRKGIKAMQSTAFERLISERDKLKAEIEGLRNKIYYLEKATILVSGGSSKISIAGDSGFPVR